MLDIDNLSAKVDKKSILNGLSLNIKPGEVHAIMGPNGSGKSTLANLLSGKKGYVVSGDLKYQGKNLKDRARIVKTNQRVKTIERIDAAEKKVKEGTQELKKLRTTGMTGKPYFKRGRKKYFPKEEGKLAHKIRKKND